MTCIGDKEVRYEDVVLHYRDVSYIFASECIILLKSINISHIVRHGRSHMCTKFYGHIEVLEIQIKYESPSADLWASLCYILLTHLTRLTV